MTPERKAEIRAHLGPSRTRIWSPIGLIEACFELLTECDRLEGELTRRSAIAEEVSARLIELREGIIAEKAEAIATARASALSELQDSLLMRSLLYGTGLRDEHSLPGPIGGLDVLMILLSTVSRGSLTSPKVGLTISFVLRQCQQLSEIYSWNVQWISTLNSFDVPLSKVRWSLTFSSAPDRVWQLRLRASEGTLELSYPRSESHRRESHA